MSESEASAAPAPSAPAPADQPAAPRRGGPGGPGGSVPEVLRYGRLRLRTLVLIRWVAVGGQAVALGVVHFGFGFPLPISLCGAVIAASVLSNIALAVTRPNATQLSGRHGAFYLGFDILQLALLLYLTGGLQNPFAMLMLAPVAIAAIALSRRAAIALCLLAVLCIAGLALWHWPLPWGEGARPLLPPLYSSGIAVALIVATLFVAVYAHSVAEAGRRMSDALTATQMALAREQRLSALGALSAALAHELGTPLASIHLAARELQSALAADSSADSSYDEDLALLLSQTERCREILRQLDRQVHGDPAGDSDSPFERLPMPALVEAAVAPYREMARPDGDVPSAIDCEAEGDPAAPPMVWRSPEILHGLGNLVENAAQFARSRVAVSTRWQGEGITVTIADDGPGFSMTVLGELGEPYLSDRGKRGHLGLGVFIAKTLLEHTGARLEFGNRPAGGARVVVRWPRGALEAGPGGQ
jgi:two-component system sensor histidine kinase RegB